MDDKKKSLRRMAIWTITIFAAIFAVVLASMWLVTYRTSGGAPLQALGAAFGSVWLVLLIVAVLCFVVYFGYSMYLKNKK